MSSTAEPISIDLSCIFCGYNLRGLDSLGFCPECGRCVRPTINHQHELEKRQIQRQNPLEIPRLDQCDPAAFSQWSEGIACLLASFVITLIGVMMAYDRHFSAFHTMTRVITLCTLVSAWVIGNWGVWKVSFRETPYRYFVYSVRLPIVVLTFLPISLQSNNGVFVALALFTLLAGLILVITWNFRLARISKILGWSKFGWQFYAVSLSTLSVVFASLEFFVPHGGISSLDDFLLVAGSPVFGFSRLCVQFVEENQFHNIFGALLVAGTFWPIVGIAILLGRIANVRKKMAVNSSPAAETRCDLNCKCRTTQNAGYIQPSCPNNRSIMLGPKDDPLRPRDH